jgi:hypothetical protein
MKVINAVGALTAHVTIIKIEKKRQDKKYIVLER